MDGLSGKVNGLLTKLDGFGNMSTIMKDNKIKTMKQEVYEILLKKRKKYTATELANNEGIGSRTYVSRLLAELIKEGRVAKTKAGRNVFYEVIDEEIGLEQRVLLLGLDEAKVWEKVRKNTQFIGGMTEQSENILYFSFTEMLNNAIDHADSLRGMVKVWREGEVIKFIVRDYGVGVFRNLMEKKGFTDEVMAIQELVKGKLTTAVKWHSGEGIFWTSKIADRFELISYDFKLRVDNKMDDYTIEKTEKMVKGTEVRFEVGLKTKKSLQELFEKYTLNRETYAFETTEIPIKLFENGGDVWISRSQAKRVLNGLEKYKRVILDFKGIELIGQGFADEIFRVFRLRHPEVEIVTENMSPSVELMVRRAQNDDMGREG